MLKKKIILSFAAIFLLVSLVLSPQALALTCEELIDYMNTYYSDPDAFREYIKGHQEMAMFEAAKIMICTQCATACALAETFKGLKGQTESVDITDVEECQVCVMELKIKKEGEEEEDCLEWLLSLAESAGITSAGANVGKEVKELSLDEIYQLEDDKDVEQGDSFAFTLAFKIGEDSLAGDILRKITETPSPFTYDQPKTSAFFEQIDQIDETTEIDTIEKVYETTTSSIPGYGQVENEKFKDEGETFEAMLEEGEAVCRNKATLLSTALERKGIDSEIVLGSDHAWVRVELNEGEYAGKTIDLDPTWYQTFVPLPEREKSGEDEPC